MYRRYKLYCKANNLLSRFASHSMYTNLETIPTAAKRRYEQHIHAIDFSPSSGDSSCIIQLSAEQGRPSDCQQNLVSHKTSTPGQHIKFMFNLKSAGFLINMTKLPTGYQVILGCCKKKIPGTVHTIVFYIINSSTYATYCIQGLS